MNYPLPSTSTDKAPSPSSSSSLESIHATTKDGFGEFGRGKILVTGPGRNGKTALCRNIIGKPFLKEIQSTIGIEQLSCNVSYATVDDGSASSGVWAECSEDILEGKSLEMGIAKAAASKLKKKTTSTAEAI